MRYTLFAYANLTPSVCLSVRWAVLYLFSIVKQHVLKLVKCIKMPNCIRAKENIVKPAYQIAPIVLWWETVGFIVLSRVDVCTSKRNQLCTV